MHRRAQILDSLYELFEPLREDSKYRYDDSEFPVQIATIQRRYIHWTVLSQQGAIPALLLNYGDNRRKRKGGENAEYASLGEIEEFLPFSLVAVMKEMPDASEGSFSRKPITDQVSDMIYTVEKLINGSRDLDVDGVVNTEVESDRSSEGAVAALEGSPWEIVKFRIIVTHIYRAATSV
ncbi:hypothetical protein C6503_19070 [Candidatus Poribacteria bacterium]|nr:MAG: hypothetical protein C6503_19070 [Candidatus Poribacteria bacterium]